MPINQESIQALSPRFTAFIQQKTIPDNRVQEAITFLNQGYPLHAAAAIGFTDIAEEFANPDNIEEKEPEKGYTALHVAVRKKGEEAVVKLIEKGANIEATDNNQFAPLHWAIGSKNVAIVRKLLEQGANSETKAKGQTALFIALDKNVQNMQIISELLHHKANVQAIAIKTGGTSLNIFEQAIANNASLKIIDKLLKYSVNIEHVTYQQFLPLISKYATDAGNLIHKAVEENCYYLIKFLWQIIPESSKGIFFAQNSENYIPSSLAVTAAEKYLKIAKFFSELQNVSITEEETETARKNKKPRVQPEPEEQPVPGSSSSSSSSSFSSQKNPDAEKGMRNLTAQTGMFSGSISRTTDSILAKWIEDQAEKGLSRDQLIGTFENALNEVLPQSSLLPSGK